MPSRTRPLDTAKAMRKQAQDYTISSDYIPEGLEGSEIDKYASRRYTIVGWLFEIRQLAQLEEETIEIALSILDRYVATKPKLVVDAVAYQLAAVTCLYISAKIHEDAFLTLDHIKLLSGNLYTPDDVEKEESLILNAIEWRVNPPTPSAFADEILNVIPSRMIQRDQIEELLKDQIHNMLYEAHFVPENDCKLAMAALYNALQLAAGGKKLPKIVETRVLNAAGLSRDDDAEILRLRTLLVGVADKIEPITPDDQAQSTADSKQGQECVEKTTTRTTTQEQDQSIAEKRTTQTITKKQDQPTVENTKEHSRARKTDRSRVRKISTQTITKKQETNNGSTRIVSASKTVMASAG
eukprot:scaffold1640_cov101-Cylindrotheca_fusiformis.AAC.10